MNIEEAIRVIESEIDNPTNGLPQDVFYFMTRITPLVNVDLLIKDTQGRVLLAWREDEFAGSGWHIPGGILRYKETLENRINEVALQECGRNIRFNSAPIAMNQMWKKSRTRGHFVSLLFECFTDDDLEPNNEGLIEGNRGYLKWHDTCPDNLILVHKKIYKEAISGNSTGPFSGEIPSNYFPSL